MNDSEKLLELFDQIWQLMSESGRCDILHSPEYRRVRAEWMRENFPVNIRHFIARYAITTSQESDHAER